MQLSVCTKDIPAQWSLYRRLGPVQLGLNREGDWDSCGVGSVHWCWDPCTIDKGPFMVNSVLSVGSRDGGAVTVQDPLPTLYQMDRQYGEIIIFPYFSNASGEIPGASGTDSNS